MRYDDWDVILFPKDSPVPIQEYKTACYVSPDEVGRQLPTLTCYISSLPPSTPFRISIHSWTTAAKPSAIIEARRKPNQKVVYTVQAIVDGARVFRGFFDIASKWPQEIAHEKHSFASVEQPTSQKKPCLEFPPFSIQALMQTSWDARDASSRIKVMLSEQLIGKAASPGDLDLGVANDIVCFSFQHAPKDVLEQAGISWPIRNPLYLPSAYERHAPRQTSSTFPCAPKMRDPPPDVHMQSPLSYRSKPASSRYRNPDPQGRPRSHVPAMSRLPKLANATKGNRCTRIWDESLAALGDDGDDFSMGAWSTKRSASSSTGDVAMPDYTFTSSHALKEHPPWANASPVYEQSTNVARAGHRLRKECDQLGQSIQAISPPKMNREVPCHFGGQQGEPMARPPTAHAYYQPKMGHAPLMTRPSSASMARTSSYPDLNTALRNVSTKAMKSKADEEDMNGQPFPAYPSSISSNKENRPPSQARMPAQVAWTSRVPTPNPFAQQLPVFDPNPPIRDPNSSFPAQSPFAQISRMPQTATGRILSAHGPSTMGSVRSRNEGMATNSPQLPQQGIRQDQNLLPAVSGTSLSAQQSAPNNQGKHTHSAKNSVPALVEIIDVDAIDPQLDENTAIDTEKLTPVKSAHRQGMSSIDSTGRLEQQLFSALGEELGSFEESIDTNGMGPELARAIGGSVDQSEFSGTTLLNPSANEFEPTSKRKRQGTIGGDRDRSPMMKREKASLMEAGEAGESVVPSLSGD
ncbi:hypothetical protein J1614_009524 [Plenodomus biglobosus]|nr:hypothetical protein J1614_009524 [Plenodomus biglobosus]